MKTILVCGAAGGIGTTICQTLLAQGYNLRALVRPEDSLDHFNFKIEIFKGYIEDPGIVNQAIQGVDAVINCAALLPNSEHLGEAAFFRVNVEGPLNILKQAALEKVPHCVFLSTLGVVDCLGRDRDLDELECFNDEAVEPYLKTKIASERLLRQESASYAGQVSILRPAFIYGPGNRAIWNEPIELVRKGKMKLVGKGDACLPLIYSEDLAAFISLLLKQEAQQKSYQIFVLASSEVTPMRKIFYAMADYFQAPRPQHIPLWVVRLAAFILSFVPIRFQFGRLRFLTKTRVRQYSLGWYTSKVAAQTPLGFTPQTRFEVGFPKMLNDYVLQKEAELKKEAPVPAPALGQ